jgi:ADP-heptose:LPS heptosyltransferase
MSPNLMRQIDYWVGIPLCFIVTCLRYISDRLALSKSRERNQSYRKLLFVKLTEMGSIILSLPLIIRAKEECQGAQVFFLTFETNRHLLELLNTVPSSQIVTIRDKSIGPFVADTYRAIKRLRATQIDIVFDLEFFSRFTALLCYFIGSPKRIGYDGYAMEGLFRGDLLTHKVQYNPLLHISKSYLAFWQAAEGDSRSTPTMGAKLEDKALLLPQFIPPVDDIKRIWRKIRHQLPGTFNPTKLVLINPGEGTIPLRDWPLKNFVYLAGRLLEDVDTSLIIVGTQKASLKAQYLYRSVKNDRCLDLTAQTSIEEFLTLCHIAHGLISNDCGLAHLASLTPIRKFILFGPESPQIFAPLGDNTWILYSELPCSPCLSVFNHRNSSCLDNRCLQEINPHHVYSLIKEKTSLP